MLKTFKNSEYKSDRYLCDALIDGIIAHKDLQNEEAYKELDLCLKDTWESSVVNKAQWSAYFLNLQKILIYAGKLERSWILAVVLVWVFCCCMR